MAGVTFSVPRMTTASPYRAYQNLPGSVGARGVADSGFSGGQYAEGYQGRLGSSGGVLGGSNFSPEANARRQEARREQWAQRMDSLLEVYNQQRASNGLEPLEWEGIDPRKRARLARLVWGQLNNPSPVTVTQAGE